MVEDKGDKIDIAKVICEASEKDQNDCPKLVELVFDKTVKTKFNFTLGTSGAEKPKERLRLNLEWTYDITVHIHGQADFNLPRLKLPPLPLTINPPSSVDELHEMLFNSIVDSAVGTGGVLLEPRNLPYFVALLAVMMAEKWTKDTIK
ncbi:hypothetical protein H9Q74_007665 [Fusarium xylarioides]|nr:hypothetical protein H9Q71_007566 [Fusarium xylarioides]KAG5822247.1 hypothetical protein H9Q74_007665 [Fusarium xylarioides]